MEISAAIFHIWQKNICIMLHVSYCWHSDTVISIACSSANAQYFLLLTQWHRYQHCMLFCQCSMFLTVHSIACSSVNAQCFLLFTALHALLPMFHSSDCLHSKTIIHFACISVSNLARHEAYLYNILIVVKFAEHPSSILLKSHKLVLPAKYCHCIFSIKLGLCAVYQSVKLDNM